MGDTTLEFVGLAMSAFSAWAAILRSKSRYLGPAQFGAECIGGASRMLNAVLCFLTVIFFWYAHIDPYFFIVLTISDFHLQWFSLHCTVSAQYFFLQYCASA